jgi:hypothetical protein
VEIVRLKKEPQEKHARIKLLTQEFETERTQIRKALAAQIHGLQTKLEEKHAQVERLQIELEEKQANAALVVTPSRVKDMRRIASSLFSECQGGDSTSGSPTGGNDRVMPTHIMLEADVSVAKFATEQAHTTSADPDTSSAPPILSHLDSFKDDVEGASMSSRSEPNVAGTTFQPPAPTTGFGDDAPTEDAPLLPVLEYDTFMSDGEGLGREENVDEMPGTEGVVYPSSSLTIGDDTQQSCTPSREADAPHGKGDSSADRSSLPAGEGSALKPLPNPIAFPMAAGSAVALTRLMLHAGSPTTENLNSAPLEQDLDTSTMDIVTFTRPAPDTDASTMENNGSAQQTPNDEITQHALANATSDVSMEETTVSPFAGGNLTSASDSRDTAPLGPSSITELYSTIDTAITEQCDDVPSTLSPGKNIRGLALEEAMPAPLQHGNDWGDFAEGMKNNDSENNHVASPGLLPFIDASKENKPIHHRVTASQSVPGVLPTVAEHPKSWDMSWDVSVEQATQQIETSDDTSRSNQKTSTPADDIEQPQSDGSTSGTDKPPINLPSQLSSSLPEVGSCVRGLEHLESTRKPLRTTDERPGDKTPQPKGAGRANKAINLTSQTPGERSDITSITSTPEQIIRQSFAKHLRAHIPLNFYYGQPDLSQVPFDPNAVILGHSQWKKRLVLNDDDLANLPSRLQEFTKRIPSEDDNQLILDLRGGSKLAEAYRSGSRDEILITMAHREHEKANSHGFGQKTAEIRHFSIVQVIRYIHGQKKVHKLFHFQPRSFSNSKID